MKTFTNKKNKINTKIYFIITLLIITTNILSGCTFSKKINLKQPLVKDIISNIKNIIDFSEMIQLDNSRFQNLYDIDPQELDELEVYISASNIKAQEVAVLKVKNDSNIEDIKKKISKRVEEQGNSFKNYLPEEYYLIENNIFKSNGSYALLVISKHADEVEDVFDESFK